MMIYADYNPEPDEVTGLGEVISMKTIEDSALENQDSSLENW